MSTDKDSDNSDISEEERIQNEIEDAEERLIYNPVTKTVDFRKYRATDAPMNANLKLPRAQTQEYEVGLELRRSEWMKAAREHITEHCDAKGRQEDNLTPAQRRGVEKLQKRVREGEIVVMQTDKSGKLAVMPLEMYISAGEEHTKLDKEVDMEVAAEIQRKVFGHTSSWLKILNVGEDHDHEDRHRSTFLIKSLNIAILSLLAKDHKVNKDQFGNIIQDNSKPPKTRAVCSAIGGFNVQLSNLISPIIEALADEMDGKCEVISSEDALFYIDRFNESQTKPQPERAAVH